MANLERKNIIQEIGKVMIRTAVVVGIIGLLARYFGKERIANIKKVFSRKK